MEKEIEKWDVYVIGFEKKVKEIGLEVEELKYEVEALVAGAVVEEHVAQEPVGSIAGVLVRVKGWLNKKGEAEVEDEKQEEKVELRYVFWSSYFHLLHLFLSGELNES